MNGIYPSPKVSGIPRTCGYIRTMTPYTERGFIVCSYKEVLFWFIHMGSLYSQRCFKETLVCVGGGVWEWGREGEFKDVILRYT